MKILSFMNVSNQQTLSTDSGYIFYNLLAEHFHESGNEFVFVAPEPLAFPKARHIPMNMGGSKYESRFSFPWNNVKDIISAEKPDLIIVNQIELLANYRSLLSTINSQSKLVGYAHCIPFGVDFDDEIIVDTSLNNDNLWQSVKFNFISGLEAADAVYVHSTTAHGFFDKMYKSHNIPFTKNKFQIVPPPYDPYLTAEPEVKDDRVMVYNHRLNAHYGVSFFVDNASALIKATSATLKVLDIMGDRSPERVRLDNSVEKVREEFAKIDGVDLTRDGCKRDKYKDILKKAKCSFAPHRQSTTWSMSCIDSLGMGVPVVAPNFGWFKELSPSDLRYNSQDEFVKITARLMNDQEYWLEKATEARNSIIELSPQNTVKKFLNSFNTLLIK